MRIKHISDTHATFPKLTGGFDIVVHSGDFFPDNSVYHNKPILSDEVFQITWLQKKASKLKKQIQDKPFLFTLGNHDFVDHDTVETILRAYNIEAYSLEDKIVNYKEFSFYGFPYIPYIYGDWNYECTTDQMRAKSLKLISDIKGKQLDVLVAHAPLHGLLDKSFDGRTLGNNILSDYLTYRLDRIDQPNWYFCGHIHHSHGINCETEINVSNAATSQNTIELY